MHIHDPRLAALPAAALFSLIAGCSEPSAQPTQTSDKPEFEIDSNALQAALEEPIQSCQDRRIECRNDAETADDRAACNDALITCLESAADEAEQIATAVRACRDDAETCVDDGRELGECRDQYESCAEAALEGDADSDDDADAGSTEDGGSAGPTLDGGAASPEEPDAGDEGASDDGATDDDNGDDDGADDRAGNDAGRPGRPGRGDALPGLPALDGGVVERLPKPLRCVVELRLCVAADRSAASECADAARMCLRER
jgi:hypothetical protein